MDKNAIKHAVLSGNCPIAAVASINTTKRIGKSGSPSELFLRRTVRPGSSGVLIKCQDLFNKEQEARAKDRDRMTERTSECRKPESFSQGEIVLIRSDKTNLWSIRCRVEQVREHSGQASISYVLTNLSTGKSLTRNKRLIRKLKGMKLNNIPVIKDLVLPSDKVRNSVIPNRSKSGAGSEDWTVRSGVFSEKVSLYVLLLSEYISTSITCLFNRCHIINIYFLIVHQ